MPGPGYNKCPKDCHNWLDSRSLQVNKASLRLIFFSVNQRETSLPIIETEPRNAC